MLLPIVLTILASMILAFIIQFTTFCVVSMHSHVGVFRTINLYFEYCLKDYRAALSMYGTILYFTISWMGWLLYLLDHLHPLK